MIVDAHVHITKEGLLPEWMSKRKRFKQRLPKLILESMDVYNIDKSIVLALDLERVLGKGYKISNEFVAENVAQHPERFIGFASVDPLGGEDAAEELKIAVEELGLTGLKLHSVAQQFYPNDKRCYPTYKMAQKLGIPINIHVGLTPAGATTERILRYKYCNPIYLDDVIRDFPDLRIIIPHLGAGFFLESFALAGVSRNVYFDTSDADLMSPHPFSITFTQILEKAIEYAGIDRILFGSEGGKDVLDRNLNLLRGAMEDLGLSNEERLKILGENAIRLIKPLKKRKGILRAGRVYNGQEETDY